MKKISEFLSENFQILEIKFSIYLNRHVFVMLLSCFGSFSPIWYVGTSKTAESVLGTLCCYMKSLKKTEACSFVLLQVLSFQGKSLKIPVCQSCLIITVTLWGCMCACVRACVCVCVRRWLMIPSVTLKISLSRLCRIDLKVKARQMMLL